MAVYRVAMDRGVCAPKGVYYGPGAVVDASKFNGEHLGRLVEAGYLVVGAEPAPEKEVVGRSGRIGPSKWDADPASLEGLSLDDLNVRILELDPDVAPFEFAEEAAAWLSQDHIPQTDA